VKISLLSDTRLRYEAAPGLLVVDAPAPDAQFSPYHMVAGGLASCTHAIMASWAQQANLSADDLVLEVSWAFVEKPHRLGNLDIHFTWPSLPAERLEAAKRVAARCPVHQSFEHAPAMAIDGTAGAPGAAAPAAPTAPPQQAPAAAEREAAVGTAPAVTASP
jgi:uncharacterized OsmC-like protein